MESKDKILFAYPATYKEEMTYEEMCIPSPYMTGLKTDTVNTIIVTVGYSLSYSRRSYMLIAIDELGREPKQDQNTKGGEMVVLKRKDFQGMSIFLSSFYVSDFEVQSSGFYQISVKLFEYDDRDEKERTPIDEFKSVFYVETSVFLNA